MRAAGEAVANYVDPNELTTEELLDAAWESGDLRALMHSGQVELTDQFMAWAEIDQTNDVEHVAGSLPRVFGVRGGKRFGKTTGALWIASMLCRMYPGCSIRYTSAFQKTIDEIIGSVQRVVFDTAPPSCRPQYFGKRGPRPAGFYFPTQGPMEGARIALAGMELNPDALRGQGNDFDFISEAAFIDKLGYTLRNVLYHQYQGRPHARMMIESSAPKKLGTDWEKTLLPDCQSRGACFTATIEDNPRLSRNEKNEFIAAAGGRGDPDCEREYFNLISADPEIQVIPEFSEQLHVGEPVRPAYAVAMAAMDPGMRDLFAVIWGYWDAARAKLVIERDWAARNTSTARVAEVIKATELELYGEQAGVRKDFGIVQPEGFVYWDGASFRANPMQRVSDTEARLIGDLTNDYGIGVMNTLKDDKEAALYALRNAFRNNKIEIHARCTKLISHVRTARWNLNRTDYERTAEHGHYDLLDALVYLWRMIQPVRAQDPFPPKYVDKNDPRVLFHQPMAVSHQTKALRDAFGGRRGSWR